MSCPAGSRRTSSSSSSASHARRRWWHWRPWPRPWRSAWSDWALVAVASASFAASLVRLHQHAVGRALLASDTSELSSHSLWLHAPSLSEERGADDLSSRRQAAAAAAGAAASESESFRERDSDKPMNILLLYADDWRHDTLGAAGNPVVKTPTLDRLASEGLRFTHNCVTTSVCWSSRVTLYTGQYTGRHNTTRPKFFYADWNETIYDLLHQNGYHVGHVGKWGVNHPYKNTIPFSVEDDGWHYRNIGDKLWHITEKNEADALRFLETRPRHKPFFVNVAFFATHAVDGDKRQYLPQNRSLSMYVDDVVPDPSTNTLESYHRLPDFFGDHNEGRTRWRWRYETEDKRQAMMKNYYRMATEVDVACGIILEELERQGDLDNTLIIFTTDNGNFHAEHGLADKWYPHQESIRVPLIIRDPRMDPNLVGTTNDDFTLNIDLAPTILSAAGIVPPDAMMGRDMSVLYRREGRPAAQAGAGVADNSAESLSARTNMTPTATATATAARRRAETDSSPWRTEFFYEHPVIVNKNYIPASEALVRKDYKYFYWPNFDLEQLFDMSSDPIEDDDLLRYSAGGDGANMSNVHRLKLEEMRQRFWELKRLVQDSRTPVIL